MLKNSSLFLLLDLMQLLEFWTRPIHSGRHLKGDQAYQYHSPYACVSKLLL